MRPSRAEFRTECPDCHTEQGAVRDRFNRSEADCSWRVSQHGKPRCTGSRMVIPEAVVWRAGVAA